MNALISVYVDRVTNLKESIENIEHFAKVHQASLDDQDDLMQSKSMTRGRTEQQVDRRKILTQILKKGLNLVVLTSIFDEDEELAARFPDSKQTSRMLYNSLNPVFSEIYQLPVQMDTKIFEYIKTKRAVFEIRHYLIPDRQQTTMTRMLQPDDIEQDSKHTGNFITLGYVRASLLQLITKNNGIDGDFVIMDDYKQKMGALKLRIALNHRNTQRPLFAGSTKIPNQMSLSKPLAGSMSRDMTTQGVNKTTTLIDKSVNLRNSIALADDLNARSVGTQGVL